MKQSGKECSSLTGPRVGFFLEVVDIMSSGAGEEKDHPDCSQLRVQKLASVVGFGGVRQRPWQGYVAQLRRRHEC